MSTVENIHVEGTKQQDNGENFIMRVFINFSNQEDEMIGAGSTLWGGDKKKLDAKHAHWEAYGLKDSCIKHTHTYCIDPISIQ
jgi:hypothetical protein